jgi:hypothetical protein
MSGARRQDGDRRAAGRRACALAATLVAVGTAPVSAQYSFNPANRDEQKPGIRYFGSVKDDSGVVISDATVMIAATQVNFVLVTDELGRFHDTLGLEMTSDKVKVTCFKAGYRPVRVTKRPGIIGPRPTVQVDCVLKREGRS